MNWPDAFAAVGVTAIVCGFVGFIIWLNERD